MTSGRKIATWLLIKSWRVYLITVCTLLCFAVFIEAVWSHTLLRMDAVVNAISSREVQVNGRRFDSLSIEYEYVNGGAVLRSSRLSVSPVSREVLGHFRYGDAKRFVKDHPVGSRIQIFMSRLNPEWVGVIDDGFLGTLWLFLIWIAIPLSNAILQYQKKKNVPTQIRGK